jgi:hypothetical protein
VIRGVKFNDGLEIATDNQQPQTAA